MGEGRGRRAEVPGAQGTKRRGSALHFDDEGPRASAMQHPRTRKTRPGACGRRAGEGAHVHPNVPSGGLGGGRAFGSWPVLSALRPCGRGEGTADLFGRQGL